ncbi:hypothetical protein [Anaerobutyricum hallii]|uniref:hypothetical protein n=1 Tax=Anaerobutyricum hallii TaxID=39488 RepID=UPI00399D3EF2
MRRRSKKGKRTCSYYVIPGVGIPLGNQTSSWFASFYLDGLDRLIKEKLQIK